jgi:hypothetical protein
MFDRRTEAVDGKLRAVVDALLRTGWREIERYYINPGRCIASARITIEVLNDYGISAEPVSVDAAVFNETAVRLLEDPDAEIPAGGKPYVIFIGPEAGPALAGKWPGHLVAVAAGRLLIDLTLPEFSRPASGIDLQPIAVPVSERFLHGTEIAHTRFGPTAVRWKALPEDRSYRGSPLWAERERIRAPAGRIIKAMRAIVLPEQSL